MSDFQLNRQLNQLIDQYRADIISDTQKLIAFDSEYAEGGGEGQPFGPKIAAALDAVLKMAADMGFSTRNAEGYMGEIDFGDPSRGKKIGAIAHIDVVPAGDGWEYPPFDGMVADGRLYGRGSVDDKGPLVATLYAMKAIKESGLPLSNHIRFLIGADEESGFRCIQHYLLDNEQPWGGFSPDGEFPVIYGEKGTYRFKSVESWMNGGDPEQHFQIKEIKGGSRMNVVPEYASARLTGGPSLHKAAEMALAAYNPEERIVLTWQEDELLVEAHGVGAHSATPWFGKSANNLLLNYLALLPLAPARAENFIRSLSRLFGDGNLGEAAGLAVDHPEFGPLTMSIGILEAGPKGGAAYFDMRYPNLDEHDQLWANIEQVFANSSLPLEQLQDKPGLFVPKDSDLIQTLLQAYQQTSGRDEPPVTIGGGTYSRAMKNFVAYGPLFPGQRELAHERNEYIDVDDLILCAKIYAQALYCLAK